MSETNLTAGASENPFRETIEIAVGPNVDGPDHMARAAHGYAAPDPAIVDNPEAPDASALRPTEE